jgi:signal peptidase I
MSNRKKSGAKEGAGKTAGEGSPRSAGGSLGVVREYLEAFLIAVIFAVFARTYVVQAFKIPSGSMEQNLLIGDHILVNKFIYGPEPTALEKRLLPVRPVRRGDVVVFKFPEDPTRDFIKRCVGLPGDRVELRAKQLIINGEPVDDALYTYHVDPRVFSTSRYNPRDVRLRDNFGPYLVPDDSYFCLGDNRDFSNDSRFWGPVPAANLKGRAFVIYWSFETAGDAGEWPGLMGKLKQLGRVAANFVSKTRWDRTFRIVR